MSKIYPDDKAPRRHPLFGRLRGCITVAPGFDLTEPADAGWAESASRQPERLKPAP